MSASRFHFQHEEPVNLKNIDKKRLKVGNLLIFSCFMMYMLSMAVKGVFASQTAFLKNLWGLSNVEIQLGNTFYFVLYALVQIFLFIFIKKIDLRVFASITLPISAVFAILMGTSTGIVQTWAYFGLTGIFQASVYSACYAVLLQALPSTLVNKANVWMNLGYACGTVIAYGLSGLCVTFNMWRIPYFIIGGVYLLSVIFFIVVSKYALRFAHINQIFNHKYQSEHASGEDNKNIEEESFIILNTKKKTAWFYIIVLALGFLVTALYYSIMSNITVFLTSVHKLPQDIGIYISVLAPVTIAIGPMITINECNKHPNFIAVGIKYMIIVVAITLLMVLFYKVSVILSLLLIIAYVVIVNGVKSIALSIMTVKMKTQINSGAFSAISNAIASIAAGVMPTVFGLILDNFGWTISFSTTLVLAVVILVSLIVVNGVIEKTNKNNIN